MEGAAGEVAGAAERDRADSKGFGAGAGEAGRDASP